MRRIAVLEHAREGMPGNRGHDRARPFHQDRESPPGVGSVGQRLDARESRRQQGRRIRRAWTGLADR